jgi:hypothetical protein
MGTNVLQNNSLESQSADKDPAEPVSDKTCVNGSTDTSDAIDRDGDASSPSTGRVGGST